MQLIYFLNVKSIVLCLLLESVPKLVSNLQTFQFDSHSYPETLPASKCVPCTVKGPPIASRVPDLVVIVMRVIEVPPSAIDCTQRLFLFLFFIIFVFFKAEMHVNQK